MQVVVLGGGGAMGATAVAHLARSPLVDELLVADRDLGRARRVAATIDAPGQVRAVDVDATDPAALHRLLAPAELILNCAGPFFRLGVPVLSAAIEAGTTYVDICDDPVPTIEMLELDEQARNSGVGALVGMGASPGLSNLLAVRAAEHLDAIENCFTAWPLDIPAPGQPGTPADEGLVDGVPSAAAIHLMEQVSGTVPTVIDGRLTERTPLEPVKLTYPDHGSGTAWTVGHPEPVTLVRSLHLTGRAANVMLMRRSTAAYLCRIRSELDAGSLSLEQAATTVLRPPRSRAVRAAVAALSTPGHGALPPFFALVTGRAGGSPRTVGCHLTAAPPGMDGATAIPAALAIEQILEQPLPPGVHPPEAVVDPMRMLAALIEHCEPRRSSVDELAPVSITPAVTPPGAS